MLLLLYRTKFKSIPQEAILFKIQVLTLFTSGSKHQIWYLIIFQLSSHVKDAWIFLL